MPGCAVRCCKNNAKDPLKRDPAVTFHRFPKPEDKRRRKAWLDACGRKTHYEGARMCSDHFDASDFERDLVGELLHLDCKRRRRVKVDAVPSVNLPGRSRAKEKNTPRAARVRRRENKKIVEDLLASCETVLGVGEEKYKCNKELRGEAETSTSTAPPITTHDTDRFASTSTKPTLHEMVFPVKTEEAGSSMSASHETYVEGDALSETPLRDIACVNLPIKMEEEESYIDENTEDNVNSDDELSTATYSEQVFPEMPGGVMKDTFELFSRYMTSILKQIPVAKSFSLQQQFINTAIKAKMDYEKLHPSKSPQRDCFSPLPPPPVYPDNITETKDKPSSKRKKKRRRHSSESDDSSPTKIQHIPVADIKQEVTEDSDPSEMNLGLESTADSILENCPSEIDFEESPEFKPDVQAPIEMVLCDDPLETEDSTSGTQKRPGRRKSNKGKSLTTRPDLKQLGKIHQTEPSNADLKRIRLNENNQGLLTTSGVPIIPNPGAITLPLSASQNQPLTNPSAISLPLSASQNQPLQTIRLPIVRNPPSLVFLTLPNNAVRLTLNTNNQASFLPQQNPPNAENT